MEILTERGVEFDAVLYLNTPPTRKDLQRMIDLIEDPPRALVRNDKNFKALGLNADDYTSVDAVVELLLEHPNLMQRPVAIKGNRAVIARPSAKIETLLD
ncbi:MAG: arsenate reductase [Proteobacteria bacterium]|nr:arsenate reductase [Pseudomonadota bacterium]